MWRGSNADPYMHLSIWAPLTADGREIVTHFQFLHHFGEPSCRMMCNCKVEKVFRMSVCKFCIVMLCMIDEYETRKGAG